MDIHGCRWVGESYGVYLGRQAPAAEALLWDRRSWDHSRGVRGLGAPSRGHRGSRHVYG